MKKLALIGCIIGLVAGTSTPRSATERGARADLEYATALGAPAAFGVWPAGPIVYDATLAIALFAPGRPGRD